MTTKHTLGQLSTQREHPKSTVSCDRVFSSLPPLATRAAAQAPMGDDGGTPAGWETTLDDLDTAPSFTLEYAGLPTLMRGLGMWLGIGDTPNAPRVTWR
jgi:hypothetical protein